MSLLLCKTLILMHFIFIFISRPLYKHEKTVPTTVVDVLEGDNLDILDSFLLPLPLPLPLLEIPCLL